MDAATLKLHVSPGARRNCVELVSGHSSREKKVMLRGLAQAGAEARPADAGKRS